MSGKDREGGTLANSCTKAASFVWKPCPPFYTSLGVKPVMGTAQDSGGLCSPMSETSVLLEGSGHWWGRWGRLASVGSLYSLPCSSSAPSSTFWAPIGFLFETAIAACCPMSWRSLLNLARQRGDWGSAWGKEDSVRKIRNELAVSSGSLWLPLILYVLWCLWVFLTWSFICLTSGHQVAVSEMTRQNLWDIHFLLKACPLPEII